MPKDAKVPELPQHVLDTRYLNELGERIFPPREWSDGEEEEEETTIELVGRDLQDSAWGRLCACDPDGRPKVEGFDEDSDDEDGWYCKFRDIEPELKMHAVLDQARLDIDAEEPSDFPRDIREEIVARYLVEYDKDFQVQIQKPSKGIKPFSPPSPTPPSGFPPFPFQRFPPEILVEIVFLAQASNPHAHIILSRVDGSLHAFVNSTPLLWSRIDFLYPLPVVYVYLERSADTLLRVTALPPLPNGSSHSTLLEDVTRDESSKMVQLLGALRPHRHRIVSLRVRCDNLGFEVSGENDLAYDFLFDGSMVKLERLDLEFGTWIGEGPKAIPPSDSIKELRLGGPWTKHYTPLLSTHLRSLVIANRLAPFSRIINAIQATPNLTSLTLCDLVCSGTKRMEGTVVTLDHLEALTLIRVFGSAAEELAKCIVAPNLASYTFQHATSLHRITEWRGINELHLFPAPQLSVRRLDLTACDGDPSWFDSVFRTFPCITHLRIASSNLTDKHLRKLVAKPTDEGESGPTPLPDLQHLTIDNEPKGLTTTYSLIASSRHSSSRPLKSMTLRGIPVDTDAAHDDIQSIREIVPSFELGGFDQDLDVYRDSDDSASETSSEGDWASGDDEIAVAFQKYYVPSGINASNEIPQNEGEE